MRKKILAFLLSVICVIGMSAPTYAVDEAESTAQQELNETMAKVVAYLNEHQKISLEHLDVQEYKIPVGDGHYVTVTTRNEQVNLNRAGGSSDLGRDYFDVVKGMSYNYTLTIKDFYLFSGKMIYTANYTIGESLGQVFKLRVNRVDLEVTAPFGCSLSEIETLDRSGGANNIIIETAGYAMFNAPLGGKLTMMVEVTFSGFVTDGFQIVADYHYFDIDDV